MPELPEVEHIRRYLADRLVGGRLAGLVPLEPGGPLVDHPRLLRFPTPDPVAFSQELTGLTVRGLVRRGKVLLFQLNRGQTLLIHLMMSGKLWVDRTPQRRHRHDRALLGFASGEVLRLEDQRKFAWLGLYTAKALGELLAPLGPEPLDGAFQLPHFRAGLARRKRSPVKGVLLDQHILVGIGNIYADEILFAARIHPTRPAGKLTPPEEQALYRAIREQLSLAVDARSGIPDQVRVGSNQPAAREALNQMHLQVYGREGAPCPACSTPIEKVRLVGRGTYLCPTCQE